MSLMLLNVIYLGNFDPPHSTENHIATALEANGHTVLRVQENVAGAFDEAAACAPNFDLVLWTRTGWDWSNIYGALGEPYAFAAQDRLRRVARACGVPVVGYHLDIWFGLNREHQLREPFFQSDIVITADGGHQAEFEALGIDHVWFPPGVSRPECELGMFRDEYHSKLAFVGSWQGHYHKEHQHRFELVAFLQKHYRKQCQFYPMPGQHAVRGADLRDLYASVDVVVGDACFCGSGLPRYVSDRLPETTGRAGFLLHPRIEGVTDGRPWGRGPTWTEDEHLICWSAGDWDELGAKIEVCLSMSTEERRSLGLFARDHVIAHHTYEQRMAQMVDLLSERNLL